MNWLIYTIDRIPDLSLVKYQSLEEDSVEGAIKKCDIFLRQFHKISAIYNIFIHLWIHFDPSGESGEKIRIMLALSYSQDSISDSLEALMKYSPIIDFFKIDLVYKGNKPPQEYKYKYKLSLKKCERKRECEIKNKENRVPLFYVEPWKTNEDSRLIGLLNTMKSMNRDVVYRVVLNGFDSFDSLYKSLEKPIAFLRNKTSNSGSQEIVLKNDELTRNFNRDIIAEETLKTYENFLKKASSSPSFVGNIDVFSDDDIVANMLINTACGEVIKDGNWEIVQFSQDEKFSILEPIIKHNNILPTTLSYWPTFFVFEEISPFFRLPALYEGEHIEIKKETEPKSSIGEIYLGDNLNGHSINLSKKLLPKHAFVCGVPGAGKTNTMLHLSYTLWKKCNIPFLVLEPAKKEYRALAQTDIEKLLVFSPSSGSKFPLAINPFEFPKGLSLAEHIQNLMDVFEGAFPLTPPLPALLDRAIEGVYTDHGWDSDDVNHGEKEYPTMSELYSQLEYELEHTSYDGEVRGNMKSALEMRIGSLLRRDLGNVFDVKISSIAPEEILRVPIIIELESMGTGPANFMTLMLCNLIREVLRANPISDSNISVRHVLFIEEAHNLIASKTEDLSTDDANPKVAATNFIVKMLAEVRALKEGIIIADQLPTAMAPEVLKNTGLKIVHRLTAQDDRALVGSTMSANELQMEDLASYLPGSALITYEGLLKPFKMEIAYFEYKEVPSTEKLLSLMSKRELYKKVSKFTFSIRLNKVKKLWRNEWNITMVVYEKLLSDCDSEKVISSPEEIETIITNVVKDQLGLDKSVKNLNKLIRKYEYVISLIDNVDVSDVNFIEHMKEQLNGLIHNTKLVIKKINFINRWN